MSNANGNYVYVENEFNLTPNDSYGTVGRQNVPANENASVSTKSTKFTPKEKCLLATTAVQGILLVVTIICVAAIYSKCLKVEEELEFCSNSKALESTNLSLLDSSFSVLELETRTKLLEVMRDMSAVITNVSQQINHLNHSHEVLASKVSLLRDELYHYQIGINKTITNTTNSQLEQVSKEFEHRITNVASNTDTQINNFARKVMEDIMVLHSFNSCEELGNLSLSFPAGIYRVRSSNCSFILKYCSSSIAFTCSGVPGQWKRIAYLNTDENPLTCPDGFEVRNGTTSNPPLCRLMDTSAGCSSVIYPSNGTSYSHVCGTIQVHPARTPDGFSSHNDQIQRNGQSVNQNYVDGVSLTYGNSSHRNHIWTYTTAITVGNDRRGCGICNFMKPSFIGTNFTCTSAHCSDGNNCYPGTLWGNEVQQCFGNETFYRQLSESTTDNIEMRVCRDQDRLDEDILITFVELFVL